MNKPKERLEELRAELRSESISQDELLELEALAAHIDPSDVELLEAAGVPEHPEPPPNIQIYDNEGETADRYTVLYLDQIERPEYVSKDYLGKPCLIGPSYNSLGMSAEPFHPQGIGQHGAAMPGKHLGRVITWEELPTDCQRAVLQDFQ